MKCDQCGVKDTGPHYHAFIDVGTARNPKIKHAWICGRCKENLKVDVEHKDEG